MTTQPIHTLYRFFDVNGDLLYVGRTVDARSRFRSHERSKEWFATVTRIDRKVYPSASALAAAEVAAIRSERPLHNVQHSTRRPPLTAVPDYPEGDERVAYRQSVYVEKWGELPAKNCVEAEPESGCECAICVRGVFVRLDVEREEHAEDLPLVAQLDDLEHTYLDGAGVIDWMYDFYDALMFRRMRLVSHSASDPAPALATVHDGLILVGCPFCYGLHEHYVMSGVAVGPIAAPCPGAGIYLPIFNCDHAFDSAHEWYQNIPELGAAS